MIRLIDKSEMFEMLLNALPGATDEWQKHLDDAEGDDLSYVGTAVFARQIVELYRVQETSSYPAVFSTVERLLLEGNDDVKGLVALGLIESVQNISSWTPHEYSVFEKWLEPNTLDAWREVEGMWHGKSSLMDVVREESKQK